MASNPLVGAWTLASYEASIEGGPPIYPYGRGASGYLIYTDEGIMSVTLMADTRPTITDAGSTEDKLKAYDTYTAYCGPYEIQGNKVIHHVKANLKPSRVGSDLVRTMEIDGNRLTLSAPRSFGGKPGVVSLVWERVSAR